MTVKTVRRGNQFLTAQASAKPQTSQFIYANFSGGYPNYADNSGSVLVNVNIPDFSLNIPTTPFNITAGQSGMLQISVVPATNNSCPGTLSCNGNLPIGSYCSLQPSIVTRASGATSTATLTLCPPSGAALVHKAFASKRGAV